MKIQIIPNESNTAGTLVQVVHAKFPDRAVSSPTALNPGEKIELNIQEGHAIVLTTGSYVVPASMSDKPNGNAVLVDTYFTDKGFTPASGITTTVGTADSSDGSTGRVDDSKKKSK